MEDLPASGTYSASTDCRCVPLSIHLHLQTSSDELEHSDTAFWLGL